MNIGVVRMRQSSFGGAELLLESFIGELIARGHSVTVFSSAWEEREGLRVVEVPSKGPRFLRPWVFAKNAARTIERERPDVVVSMEKVPGVDVYRADDGCHREWLRRRANASGFLKRLGILLKPLNWTILALEKRLYGSPGLKAVVALSRRGKEEIINHYGLSAKKIRVICNGIETSGLSFDDRVRQRARVREEFGLGPDDVVLLFVGTGFERKGLVYLIRALKVLKDRNPGLGLKALVIGKGSTRRYENEARRLGVGSDVVFAGPVKGATRCYPAGDVFVLPTIYEPFGNTCLEAMAAGLPVVVSEVAGASEVIPESAGEVVRDPTDPVELAGKISAFLDDSRRERAGQSAREEAGEHTLKANVDGLMELIEEVRREKAL